MINIEISHLKLHKILLNRINNGDSVSSVLNGLLISLSGDASELLGFIRYKFPSYTGHDLQHSWRILKRLENILTIEALESLSSIEIFSLIIAVAFHDVGMISKDIESNDLRGIHHIKSNEFLKSYLADRMSSISEYSNRLIKCIGFIARAHGMTWEDLTSSELFNRHERIIDQPLRVNILCILIRIGDLLDLDSDRSCDPLRRHTYYFDNKESNFHHERHKNVSHFYYDSEKIDIEVSAYSKEEHSIWTEWFGYINQDILHANSYIFKGELNKFQLPKFYSKVVRGNNANYELWPLRFEIDEQGKIWNVISQSVYTGKFDFIRELIQNAIDACLKWIYINQNGIVQGSNPKKWYLKNYEPSISILYSSEFNTLTIQDNGIGMDRDSLKKFLFNVASSGYKGTDIVKGIPFPSIASFGIGFVACLVRAQKIIINTKSREETDHAGREVVLKTEALDAYSELLDCQFGTKITLYLSNNYKFGDISKYLRSRFYSPSVSIKAYDLDTLNKASEFFKLKDANKDILEFLSVVNEENLVKNINREITTYNESGKEKLSFPEFFFRSESNESLGIGFDKPIFLFLDKLFKIRYLSDDFTKDDLVFENSLVFIPVRFFDDQIGIEWFSIHGFVLHERSHKKSIIRYTGLADKFLDEDRVIIRSEEEWHYEDLDLESYGDENDLFESYFDYQDSEFDDDENDFSFFISKINKTENIDAILRDNFSDNYRLKLCEKINGIMISDIQAGYLLEYKFIENLKEPILDKKGKIIRRFISDDDDRRIGEVDFLINNQLDGSVYQDGILLPLKAWAIAPIGACYAKVNLFGNSRFELNVTRNSINESSILLENWMNNIGFKIQNKIIDQIVKVFEDNEIEYKNENFITDKNINGQDNIYEYSLPLLKKLINLKK